MTTFIHSFSSRQVLCVDHAHFKTVKELKSYLAEEKGLPKDATFFICNGSLVKDSEPVKKDVTYHTHIRILGGKGGFGSMLRAIGAQIEKTTNHEACRDLSGRRMRDVNNEKDLKEWLGKQAEREREREQKRQERIARRRAMPNHKFDDPLYHQQRSLVAENQEDALQTGLKKLISKPGTSATVTSEEMLGTKRKSETQGQRPGTSKKKKDMEWLGIDIDNISDLDSEEDSSNSEEYFNEQTIPGESEQAQDIQRQDSNSAESEKNSSDESNSNHKSEVQKATQYQSTEISGNKICGKSDTNTRNTENSDIKTNADDDTVRKTTEETESGKEASSKEESQPEKPFCLEDVSNTQELEQLGLDRLKQELMERGLKCGGTLQQRADRLFSIKGLTRDQIHPALFSKSADGKKVKNKR